MELYSRGNSIIKIAVILADFVLLNVLLILLMLILPDSVPGYVKANLKFVFLIANIAMFIAQLVLPPIMHERYMSFDNIVLRAIKFVLLQSAMFFVFVRVVGQAGGFFEFLMIYMPLLFGFIIISRFAEWMLLKYIRKSGYNYRTVLFLGEDRGNLMIFNKMVEDPSTGYRVLGYFADGRMENEPEDLNYLGTIDDFKQCAQNGNNSRIDEMYCSLPQGQSENIVTAMKYCDKHVARFYYVPQQFGNFRLNLKPELFGEQYIYTNHHEPLEKVENRIIKRIFDIVFSGITCLVILPFMPIIALIIKMQSPGPLLFVQDRTGYRGKTFRCYKFRSMHVNSDADHLQASKDDPRKFPFGNFMRKTNIDEFPQFFNVLKGDMSIVGPRPHMLLHTEEYSAIIDKYMLRHFSKPGITGYAQVTGFRGETKEVWQMEERVKRDIWYNENWSFWLDIKIIFKTALSIIIPDKHAY